MPRCPILQCLHEGVYRSPGGPSVGCDGSMFLKAQCLRPVFLAVSLDGPFIWDVIRVLMLIVVLCSDFTGTTVLAPITRDGELDRDRSCSGCQQAELKRSS
jgi:hypothetical protein